LCNLPAPAALYTPPQSDCATELLARGRESGPEIEHRLDQAVRLDNALADQPLRRIDNNGTLAEAAAQLRRILLDHTP